MLAAAGEWGARLRAASSSRCRMILTTTVTLTAKVRPADMAPAWLMTLPARWPASVLRHRRATL